MVRTSAFPPGQEWTGLLAAVDDSLRLHQHTPGTLPNLAAYLHQRTGGMIGSLLRLIRSAAIQAILDGSEQLTRQSLNDINIDTAADYIAAPSS